MYHISAAAVLLSRHGARANITNRLRRVCWKQMSGFAELQLRSDLVECLTSQGISTPTPVQSLVIPLLLQGENVLLAASTGSGKTLTFTLPAIQQLKAQEENGYLRQASRPRCLVLVPTRDLAKQVLSTVKKLSHHVKISSGAVLGGEETAQQKDMLSGHVDIVVASPGRLLLQKEKGNVYFGHVTHVIIDEVDTMLTQGFGADIRAILQSVVLHPNKTEAAERRVSAMGPAAAAGGAGPLIQKISVSDSPISKVQVIMASASVTKPVRALVGDMEGFNIGFKDQINPSTRMGAGAGAGAAAAAGGAAQEERVQMKVVEVDGFHKALPNVQHNMLEVKGKDKIAAVTDLLQTRKGKHMRTMIFCNTIDSCRALSYQLEMSNTLDISGELFASYHGDLKSEDREKNLNTFRDGHCQYLICTDIAARGLDIPNVDHVVMFDFPLNPIDYLHRSGRTGRAGRAGRVTSLVGKRDLVLARAIQSAISKNLPLDSLTSSKRDYLSTGKLAAVVGQARRTGPDADPFGLRTAPTVSPRGPHRAAGSGLRSGRRSRGANQAANADPRGSRKGSPARNDSGSKKMSKLSARDRIRRKKSDENIGNRVKNYNAMSRTQYKG